MSRFLLLWFLLIASALFTPQGLNALADATASRSCLAPSLNRAEDLDPDSVQKTSSDVPDIWNTRLLVIDYRGAIVPRDQQFPLARSLRAVDSIHPDEWARPFSETTTGDLRRFIYVTSLINHIFELNPTVTVMVTASEKTAFDALFDTEGVTFHGAFPRLYQAYQDGRFIVTTGEKNKIFEIRDCTYRRHIAQKNIVAVGTDSKTALELGRFIRIPQQHKALPETAMETPLTGLLQEIIFKSLETDMLDARLSA